jgi:hypothetical protein
MRSERGQGSVEWIGLVLLVALALGALARLAPRGDGEDGGEAHALGASLARSLRVSAERIPAGDSRSGPARPAPGAAAPRRQVTAPPLVPVVPGNEVAPRSNLGRAFDRLRHSPLARRARRSAGTLWRRAWLVCLGYERARYEVLHPEAAIPGHNAPPREVLRIANDCLSPIDFVRDWPLIRDGVGR